MTIAPRNSDSIPPLDPNEGLVGHDGWVFLGNKYVFERDQALGTHVASDDHIARLAGWVRGMAEAAAAEKVPFLFIVSPAKWAVYPDKIPVSGKPGPSIFDRLQAALGRPDYLVDLRAPLIEARNIADTYSPLNSHWTDFGAAVAWKTIAGRLTDLFPAERFRHSDEEPGVETIDALNECAQLMGVQGENPWTVPVHARSLPNYEFIAHNFDHSLQVGSRQVDLLELPMQTLGHDASSSKKAFIIRDSTGTQISPFMVGAFAKTWQVFHNLAGAVRGPYFPGEAGLRANFIGRIRQYAPDVVLYIVTERYLGLDIDTDAYWAAFKDFENAKADAAHAWPHRPGCRHLRFDDDPTLSKSVCLDLSVFAASDGPRIVRLRLIAKESAAICLGYTQSNVPSSTWYWLEPGVNEVYQQVPAQIDLGHFWIAKHDDSSPLTLAEIEFRPLG